MLPRSTPSLDWLRAEEINRLERMYLLGPTAEIEKLSDTDLVILINGMQAWWADYERRCREGGQQ